MKLCNTTFNTKISAKQRRSSKRPDLKQSLKGIWKDKWSQRFSGRLRSNTKSNRNSSKHILFNTTFNTKISAKQRRSRKKRIEKEKYSKRFPGKSAPILNQIEASPKTSSAQDYFQYENLRQAAPTQHQHSANTPKINVVRQFARSTRAISAACHASNAKIEILLPFFRDRYAQKCCKGDMFANVFRTAAGKNQMHFCWMNLKWSDRHERERDIRERHSRETLETDIQERRARETLEKDIQERH